MKGQEPHYMQLPREVLIGENILKRLGETCERLGFSSLALVVTGPKVYPLINYTISDSLAAGGLKAQYAIAEKSTIDEARGIQRKAQKIKPDVVVGVGGGKDIDVAKFASANLNLPFISVPTAPSHDGIASPLVSLRGYKKPYSFRGQAPQAILADLETIAKSPYRLIASGCGDIIAKHTAVKDWQLAHRIKGEYYGEYAANLALMSARLLMRNAVAVKSGSIDGARIVVEALISCGVAMSIAGTSRPCSGAEHLFSHALALISRTPALHGEQCGVGSILMAYLQGSKWQLIRNVLQKIGAPTSGRELGIDDNLIIRALAAAHKIRPERYTILGDSGIATQDARRVAKATGVID